MPGFIGLALFLGYQTLNVFLWGQLHFNQIDKLMEAVEEIKQLNAALIKEKDEKIGLLEKMLGEKQGNSRENVPGMDGKIYQ